MGAAFLCTFSEDLQERCSPEQEDQSVNNTTKQVEFYLSIFIFFQEQQEAAASTLPVWSRGLHPAHWDGTSRSNPAGLRGGRPV